MSKLLLIDGNSLLNRAYYAFGVKSGEKLSFNGQPTNATYGFLNMLFRGVADIKPSHVAVAFDVREKTFRHKLSVDYKAHRKGMPDDLAAQLEDLKIVLQVMGVKVFELPGWEADDIIGAIAEESPAQTIILTADRDALQLVSHKTELHLTKTGVTKLDIWTHERVQAEFGLDPENLIDLKALAGDKSDNIPGALGVGDKTALDLIQKFRTIETLYMSLDKVAGHVADKLRNSHEQVLISKKLARIDCKAPLKFNLDECVFSLPFNDKVGKAFADRGFASFLKRKELFDLPIESLPTKKQCSCTVGRCLFCMNVPQQKYYFQPDNILVEQSIIEHLLSKKINPSDTEAIKEELRQKGMWELYKDIELPLVDILLKMNKNGAKVARKALDEVSADFKQKLDELSREIFAHAGESFNINSTKALGEILFKKLGLATSSSTKEEVLLKLANKHPIVPPLLRYRKLFKLYSNYAQGYKNLINDAGFVHSTWNNTSTVTGRLSSTEPNMQNIPIRGDEADKIRKLFVSRFDGGKLLCADYSQIELRILAHLSGDEVMTEAFKKGRDIHAETASKLQADRRIAKAVNFGIIYGISAFGLAQTLGVKQAQASLFIEKYFKEFPKIKTFLDSCVDHMRQHGYVKTLYGRRRYIDGRTAFDTRAAMNMPMQGTAADLVKRAMIAIDKRMTEEGRESLLIAQIHDELVFDCPEHEVEAMSKLAREEMLRAGELNVPLVVDISVGDTLK